MKILTRFLKGPRCSGCGDIAAHVEEKTHLCPPCWGIYLKVEERKQKLESTLRQRFIFGVRP